MAVATQIVAGQKGWAEALNGDLSKLVEDTGWITAGITLLNGAIVANEAVSSQPKYRTLTFAGSKLTVVQASVTTTKDGQGLSFPTGVSPDRGDTYTTTKPNRFTNWSWDGDKLICHYEPDTPTTSIFNGIYFVFLYK